MLKLKCTFSIMALPVGILKIVEAKKIEELPQELKEKIFKILKEGAEKEYKQYLVQEQVLQNMRRNELRNKQRMAEKKLSS